MRMLPSRYVRADPALTKGRPAAERRHVSAPLKGLNLLSKLTTSDPLLAPILDNWVVEENVIRCRPGYRRTVQASAMPVECLVPFYGAPNRLAAATNGTLVDMAGSTIADGFTSNDWHWTAFSNLSSHDYTVMVNGADGVWSWDGTSISTDPAPVAVTNLSNANPAVCTVAAGDIGQFANGMVITVAGAIGAGMTVANGQRLIAGVNPATNTFVLAGIDTSGGAAPQTSGVTADPPGTGFVREVVTAPSTGPHIVPDQFQLVLSHMNRLWFADSANLAVYYLPLQQKSGEVKELPLNAIFKRGGSIRAMYTWTVDGGMGLDDQLVIFSTNGECAIYGGIDPDTGMQLAGVYRFDSPMSKHSVVQYGGDLYVLISTGLVPMSTLMRAETEQLGRSDKSVVTEFTKISIPYRHKAGWAAMLDHASGRIICNMPLGAPDKYRQLVRFMPTPIWASWSALPARCWGWVDNRLFFGGDDGAVYEMSPLFLNDLGQPIIVDMQTAWSAFGTPADKQFKMVRPYIQTDSGGTTRPLIDIRVDYDVSIPINQPDVTIGVTGSEWGIAAWDTSYWATGAQTKSNWQGVSANGTVGAVRLRAAILNCDYAIAGFDVRFERGSL